MKNGWSMLLTMSFMACGEKEDNPETEVEDSAIEVEENTEDTDDIEENIDNSLFYLAENGITVMCPEADFGEQGIVNGSTYTKRTREGLRSLVRDDLFSDVEQTCVSGITDMTGLFLNPTYIETSFNGDISSWDVSSVTNMSEMFLNADSFTGDISNWDVSNVTVMIDMFRFSDFNGDISSWNVSSVIYMDYMFAGSDFNQNISTWDVNSVIYMESMFRGASSFNSDISGWDVSSVLHTYSSESLNYTQGMKAMFKDASSFNQDLSSWCVSRIPSAPPSFDTGATSWTEPRPIWGTCP